MPSETSTGGTSRIEDAEERGLNVVNGHQWRKSKTTPVGPYGGERVREWQCVGCGETASSKDGAGECPSPTVWVRLGCPRDGIGVCRDCGAVFAFDYGEEPFYEHTCPECDSIKWDRDDDADADPDDVIGVPATDGGTVEDGIERRSIIKTLENKHTNVGVPSYRWRFCENCETWVKISGDSKLSISQCTHCDHWAQETDVPPECADSWSDVVDYDGYARITRLHADYDWKHRKDATETEHDGGEP